jgi:hypothetical protein
LTLEQLKKILRAARELTDEADFYVIGSAAILQVFNAPEHMSLSRSNEADLIAFSGDPDIADMLSVMIGELSPFHARHDVYADGVTFDTPQFAPKGWQDQAVVVHFKDIGVTARFMELHDLTLSKLGAGRPKDMEFCEALSATGYLNQGILRERLLKVDCTEVKRRQIESSINRYFP